MTNKILTIDDIQLLKVGDKVTLAKATEYELSILRKWDGNIFLGKTYTIKKIEKTDTMHSWKANLNNPRVTPGNFSMAWGYWTTDKLIKRDIKKIYQELKKPYII